MCCQSVALAQSRIKKDILKVDSVLSAKREHTSYDTSYIVRPNSRLTLKVRTNLSGDDVHARGTVHDVYATANLHTRRKLTLSLAAIYQGIGVGFALNPAKIFGNYNDYELNLHYYGTRFGVDFSYHNSKTLSGEITRDGRAVDLESGNADMKVANIAAYYVFNHRHFSYAAAFMQSYIQQRSAGSWLAGLSYQGGTAGTSDDAPADMTDLRIKAHHLGIGGGYGYNLVAGKWLFHFSALPTVVVYNKNSLTVNGERQSAQTIRLNVLLNERLSVVYNISPRYFVSATGVVYNTIFDDKRVVVNQNKWRVRAAFGMRLWPH